jgi:hypothetical protein
MKKDILGTKTKHTDLVITAVDSICMAEPMVKLD